MPRSLERHSQSVVTGGQDPPLSQRAAATQAMNSPCLDATARAKTPCYCGVMKFAKTNSATAMPAV